MNYNKHLEELQKYRDSIRDIQNELEGLSIELGNYMDEVEGMRDDYDAKSNLDFDDGEHLTKKGKTELEPDTLGEQLKKKRQILAGIK